MSIRRIKPANFSALMVLLTTFFSLPALAGVEGVEPIDSLGACKDGADFTSAVSAIVRKWSDYTCDSELWNYKPDKTTKSSCHFFYKDNQIRVQVTGGGFRDGAVLVRRKDGTVRAKGGGMLGFMTMNLDPDSRMLILPNGTNVLHSDLPEVFSEIQQQLAKGYKSKVTSSAVAITDIVQKTYVLDEYDPGGVLTRRIFCAAEGKVPLRIDLYRGGKRVSSAWFKNLTANAGVADDLFQL